MSPLALLAGFGSNDFELVWSQRDPRGRITELSARRQALRRHNPAS